MTEITVAFPPFSVCLPLVRLNLLELCTVRCFKNGIFEFWVSVIFWLLVRTRPFRNLHLSSLYRKSKQQSLQIIATPTAPNHPMSNNATKPNPNSSLSNSKRQTRPKSTNGPPSIDVMAPPDKNADTTADTC
jgi:hypothetical protein